jgi:hypothetical protein
MLSALVLICSVGIAPDRPSCTLENAIAVMRVPGEFGNPATCFMRGQSFLAGTSIGQELDQEQWVKVLCARGETINRSVPLLTVK